MSTSLDQLQTLAEQLSLEEKKRAIEIMQALIDAETSKPELPPGTSGSFFLKFHIPIEDVEIMERVIQEDCEGMYPDEY